MRWLDEFRSRNQPPPKRIRPTIACERQPSGTTASTPSTKTKPTMASPAEPRPARPAQRRSLRWPAHSRPFSPVRGVSQLALAGPSSLPLALAAGVGAYPNREVLEVLRHAGAGSVIHHGHGGGQGVGRSENSRS